jgi:hypothetical protein
MFFKDIGYSSMSLAFYDIEGEIESEGNIEVDADEKTIEVDVDADAETDVKVDASDEIPEVEVDIEGNREVKDFCQPGSTYTYASEEGSVDAEVIGLEMYKGSEFCKAESTTTINSPAGEMVTETIYHFNSDQSEFWVTTTTSGAMLPQSQTNTVHIVDGEPVS